jgi:hypothetical protein
MKRPLFAAALCLITAAAFAEDAKLGPIEITHPWSRATPKGASVGGGYLTVRNTGPTPDRLIGGSLEGAARVELHEMSMDGGVMKMREVKGGLEIKPGESVAKTKSNTSRYAWGAREIGEEIDRTPSQVHYLFAKGMLGDAVVKAGHKTLIGDRVKLRSLTTVLAPKT